MKKQNEKTSYKNYRFLLNNRFVLANFKKRYFFTKWKIFSNDHLKNDRFFTERTILLNKQVYWTIVHWENERNKRKMNDNFENERWTNEIKKILKRAISKSGYIDIRIWWKEFVANVQLLLQNKNEIFLHLQRIFTVWWAEAEWVKLAGG